MDRLPQIRYEDKRATESSAVHRDLHFCGNLKRWTSFEEEVDQVFRDNFHKWDSFPRNILHVVLKDPVKNAISNEHYLCGEELSSSGRYVQHVLHVMTAVGRELGFKLWFGDWYTSYDHGEKPASKTKSSDGPNISEVQPTKPNARGKKIIPDYALLAEGGVGNPKSYARALGEAKSPYGAHDFERWVDDAFYGNDKRLRQLLGKFLLTLFSMLDSRC